MRVGILLAGMADDACQRSKSSQSHFAKSRQRGRTILQHVTNLFSKRGKRTLTDVSANT